MEHLRIGDRNYIHVRLYVCMHIYTYVCMHMNMDVVVFLYSNKKLKSKVECFKQQCVSWARLTNVAVRM